MSSLATVYTNESSSSTIKSSVLSFLPLLVSILPAQDLTAKGYDHFYNLEFDQAVEVFRESAAKDAGNANPHNHLAQALLYREMLRSGALESELVTGTNPFLRRQKLKVSDDDQKLFESSIAKSMSLTQAALARKADDVDAMYALGVAHGLRGNFNFLVRKSWTEALRDITASRKLHQRVTQLRPSLHDARLVQGVHDYVVGSLPFTYKMLGFIVGFRGDKEGGIRTLQAVASQGTINRTDAKVLLCIAYRRERRPADAIPLLKTLLADYPRNYLFRLEMVQMYGDMGDKQKALDTLVELDKLKAAATPGLAALPAEKINASRGTLLFWYRDYDGAITELRKAAAKAKDLDLNTASMALLRLGQCYDMKQQRAQALESYRAALALAPDSDAARQARNYVSSPYKRGKE
ncbi:MAG: tetratricopeptide repeat protein [Candidatus Solibacter usitatus]|nr:tetratricopeptide repeat protein [Candidatus Solibacter usitatus]